LFSALTHVKWDCVQERVAEAVSLARRHSSAPHFARSLEWLLFTSLELNAGVLPSPSKSAVSSGWSPASTPERRRRPDSAGPLLLAAASLLRNFPQVSGIPCALHTQVQTVIW
jgi:hypothetical protein